ncbi:hypothetical protein HO133_011058 [Letharia lupina]|uniref:Uncharacterized protein n=1 Tax=Letharia lupina TaxID=560253 RepID=A0A8H6FDW3_9LECA|nr:uncharacterized protein HO133_011058 [Letharia lupina]KAF6224481.1 hypothetical protein HO133_011058 [Letharia lupina]
MGSLTREENPRYRFRLRTHTSSTANPAPTADLLNRTHNHHRGNVGPTISTPVPATSLRELDNKCAKARASKPSANPIAVAEHRLEATETKKHARQRCRGKDISGAEKGQEGGCGSVVAGALCMALMGAEKVELLG